MDLYKDSIQQCLVVSIVGNYNKCLQKKKKLYFSVDIFFFGNFRDGFMALHANDSKSLNSFFAECLCVILTKIEKVS